MSIASELQKLQTNMANAYSAISSAGGTMPEHQNLDNLASAINTIPTPEPYTQPTYYAWVKGTSIVPPSMGMNTYPAIIVFTNTMTAGATIYTVPSNLATKPTANDLTATTDKLQNITYENFLGKSCIFSSSVSTAGKGTAMVRPVSVNENFEFDILPASAEVVEPGGGDVITDPVVPSR